MMTGRVFGWVYDDIDLKIICKSVPEYWVLVALSSVEELSDLSLFDKKVGG
jgi:hypothetical protein